MIGSVISATYYILLLLITIAWTGCTLIRAYGHKEAKECIGENFGNKIISHAEAATVFVNIIAMIAIGIALSLIGQKLNI